MKTDNTQLGGGTQHGLVRFKFWASGTACGIKIKTTGYVLSANEHDAFEDALRLMQSKFAGYVENASPGVVAYPAIKRCKSNPSHQPHRTLCGVGLDGVVGQSELNNKAARPESEA